MLEGHCTHHEANTQEIAKLRAMCEGQKEWTGKIEQRLERQAELNSKCHADMSESITELEGKVDTLALRMIRVEERLDKIEADVSEIKATLNKALGILKFLVAFIIPTAGLIFAILHFAIG